MNQKRIFMFEQLLAYCNYETELISKFLGIDCNITGFNCNDEEEFARQLYEKYSGTWWEVTFDNSSGDVSDSSMCVYLADSIQDALRLRPKTNESYWQNALKYFDQMIANMYDMEEECV